MTPSITIVPKTNFDKKKLGFSFTLTCLGYQNFLRLRRKQSLYQDNLKSTCAYMDIDKFKAKIDNEGLYSDD